MLPYLPVTTLCTKSRLKEFLVTKFSLEQYHSCRWTVATDQASYDYLSTRFPNERWVRLIDEEASHIKGEYEPFLRVVLNKMQIMAQCIDEHGSTLFVDSDLLFTSPIDLELLSRHSVVVSPHYIPLSHITDMHGNYNVGFIFCRDKSFIRTWLDLTTAHFDPDGLEQKPYEWAAEYYSGNRGVFHQGYNVGWWRIYHDHPHFAESIQVQPGRIMVGDREVICFHFHCDRGVRRSDEEIFAQLVDQLLDRSGRSEHTALRNFWATEVGLPCAAQ